MVDNLKTELTDKKYLNKKDYILYGLATFANGAVIGMTQGYLFFFYIQVLGINPIVASTMFLLAKIFDGVNDPIMGTVVDRTRTKWGKLRPYLLFGSIPLGLILISTFLPINFLPYAGKVVYIYITYFMFGIIATLVGVPLWGMAATVSPNSMERTKIISIGQILASIGEQSGLVLYSLLCIFMGMTQSLVISAILIGVLAPIFIIMSALRLKERIEPSLDKPNLFDGFKYLVKNKPFLVSTIANLVSFFRNLVSASIIYVVTYIFYRPGLMIFFALPGAIAAMIGMLLAPALKKKFNAKQLFIYATIAHSLGLTMVYLVGADFGWMVTAALMFIAMLPVGILNVVPPLIAADTIDFWEHKTGERREGITFAFMGFRSKVSSGLKDFILGLLITWAGFEELGIGELIAGEEDVYKQGARFETRMFLIYTIIPAVTNLLSIIPMFFYDLTGEKLKTIQTELALQRKKKNEVEEIESF